MTRYETPGLPDWPLLYFDPHRRMAVVLATYVNWRSLRSAGYASAAILWLVTVTTLVVIWHSFAWINPAERLVYAFFAWLAVIGVTSSVLRKLVKPFLSRTLFARTTRFAVDQDAIAIDKRVLERAYQDETLAFSFRISPDQAAARMAQAPNIKPIDRHELSSARKLEMVIAGDPTFQIAPGSQFVGGGRSETVAELPNDEIAEQFSTICAAALNLTSGAAEAMFQQDAKDIDEAMWN